MVKNKINGASRASRLFYSMRNSPGYTLMRGFARFKILRNLVKNARHCMQKKKLNVFLSACEEKFSESLFPNLDKKDFVRKLRADGAAFGISLPSSVIQEIIKYTEKKPCFADREYDKGFLLEDRVNAENKIGKPILVAQYFNVDTDCAIVHKLRNDPVLLWIAGTYLQSVPTFVGANLWWTFPVHALDEDRDRHAHLFHRDVDDFCFFKFFFYLTNVEAEDGPHVLVLASHEKPPVILKYDQWKIRRYSDDEVSSCYGVNNILEIKGASGTGFAENTLCVHKGKTPEKNPRLLLQVQYALFDYGVMHDRRDESVLKMI